MTDRRESRKKVYCYIAEQAKKLNLDLSNRTNDRMTKVNFISLNDLAALKEGLSDPPQELVASLKKLLRTIASDAKIDDYLVRPFSFRD